MKSEIQNIGRHTLVYGIGIVLSKSVSFIMLPLYTRFLSPSDYGTLELLAMTIDVISMFAGMGLASTIFKFYAQYDSEKQKNLIISTALIMAQLVSILTAGICIYFSGILANLVFGSQINSYYFKIILISYALENCVTIPLIFIRARNNSVFFVITNLLKLIVQLALNIYFLTILKLGVLSILYGTLITNSVFGLGLTAYTLCSTGIKFSSSRCIDMLYFGYPLVFWYFGSFILTFSDRYFLRAYATLADVGIYALAYKFGFILALLAFEPFNLIWEPRRYEIAKNQEANDIFNRMFTYLNFVIIALALIISLFVKDVLSIMATPSYWPAYRLVPMILMAYILQAWSSFCNVGLFLANKTKLTALAALISSSSVLAFNFLLIPSYGAYGAALATLFAFGIRFVLIYTFSQKQYYVRYNWSSPIYILGLATILYCIRDWANLSSLGLSLAFSAVLTVLFLFFIYSLLLNDTERGYVKRLMSQAVSYANLRKIGC